VPYYAPDKGAGVVVNLEDVSANELAQELLNVVLGMPETKPDK